MRNKNIVVINFTVNLTQILTKRQVSKMLLNFIPNLTWCISFCVLLTYCQKV